MHKKKWLTCGGMSQGDIKVYNPTNLKCIQETSRNLPEKCMYLSGWCSTPTQLFICSSFSRENGHPLLICSSLSTAQLCFNLRQSFAGEKPKEVLKCHDFFLSMLLKIYKPLASILLLNRGRKNCKRKGFSRQCVHRWHRSLNTGKAFEIGRLSGSKMKKLRNDEGVMQESCRSEAGIMMMMMMMMVMMLVMLILMIKLPYSSPNALIESTKNSGTSGTAHQGAKAGGEGTLVGGCKQHSGCHLDVYTTHP